MRRNISLGYLGKEAQEAACQQAAFLADVLYQHNCAGNAHQGLLPPLGNIEETVYQKGYSHTQHKDGHCREAAESKAIEKSLKTFAEARERLAALDEKRHKQRVQERCNQNFAHYAAYGSGHSTEEPSLGESEEIQIG